MNTPEALERELNNMQDQRDFAMEVIARLERERDEAREAIVGWENKWKCAVEMAAQAEVERDEAREAGWKAAMQAIWDRLPMPQYASDPMTPREVAKHIEFVRSQKEAAK